ncbi:MAG: type II secretion system F family protein [Lachnospiraceae bacterium]
MANFKYVALNSKGKEKKGQLEAVNKDQLSQQLKQEGLMLVKCTELADREQDTGISLDMEIELGSGKPSPRDMAVFCRQFVSIVTAGVPITAALEMLAEQTEHQKLSKAIAYCATSIQKGSSLSQAMQERPKVFDNLLITMVAAGEVAGNLEIAFERMAVQYEKDAKIRASIKKASIYPIAVCIVAVAVIMVLLIFVIPNFETLLTDLGTELPFITVMVLELGDFVQAYWYLILVAFAGIAFFFTYFAKTESGQLLFGKIQLKIPLLGALTTKSASARTCRTLSTLLAAGVPMVEAIEIVANTMDNIYYKEALFTARDDVSTGAPLSEPLERVGLFPPLVYHMVKIGEQSGDIDGMMTKIADYYDEEVEEATAALMAAMEPAIIVVLALIVGTIVMAVMLPMMEMYSALDNL